MHNTYTLTFLKTLTTRAIFLNLKLRCPGLLDCIYRSLPTGTNVKEDHVGESHIIHNFFYFCIKTDLAWLIYKVLPHFILSEGSVLCLPESVQFTLCQVQTENELFLLDVNHPRSGRGRPVIRAGVFLPASTGRSVNKDASTFLPFISHTALPEARKCLLNRPASERKRNLEFGNQIKF